ncbi:hypothetical protein TNIN_83961 [Trichonephila inaurata madagascariensis]|uniref:Uncharacterized protein n=1 Tax=Trichonephila inaurata madagascariensis TaxID=2747483 RepID=A0A8X6MJ50_9ARAC|nr:hypothetical protein TNIN_83961 [Trichonephila inaurata madagascariensis]
MTLKMQFNDLVQKMDDLMLMDVGEDEFIECILSSMSIKKKFDEKKEELQGLKKTLVKKKKEVGGLKSKLKTQRYIQFDFL